MHGSILMVLCILLFLVVTSFVVGNATCPIQGCTDSLALNYDATATYDDGSCTYPCLDTEVAMNLYDSYGDGWNGATWTITDANAAVVATGGLASGAFELGTLCLVDGCYSITVGGGTFDGEITFDFADLVAIRTNL